MESTPEPEDGRELYALLHLSPDASGEEIRRAYRQYAQIYHPDKYQDPQVQGAAPLPPPMAPSPRRSFQFDRLEVLAGLGLRATLSSVMDFTDETPID
jgi:hypothetical protein